MNNIAGFGRTNNPGGGSGVPQGEPSCGEKIAQIWAGVPLFNRFLFWSSIIIYLVSFILPEAVYYTINVPAYVYMKFQIWRIVTAPISNISIFMLLFGLLSYMPRGCQVEKMKGTTNFFIYFMLMSIISQSLMVILAFIINLLIRFPSFSLGLWTMVMVDMTVDSLKEPDLPRNLC